MSISSDAQDMANIDAVMARIAAGETEVFPFEVAERLLDGEHPVKVFREHRGHSIRGLAELADMSPSYLSEIEAGEKAGNFDALKRISAALKISLDLVT
jgi:hypothetical protein